MSARLSRDCAKLSINEAVLRRTVLEQHAITSGPFGLVQGFVRRSDELLGRFDLQLGERGNSHADRDGHTRSFMLERRKLHRRSQSLAKNSSVAQVHTTTEHREFFTAVTSKHILGTHRVLCDFGDPHQHVIAREMSVRVVHALEVIDVEHDERERRDVALGVGELRLESADEITLVESFRQTVAQRGVEHALLEIDVEMIVVRELEDRDRSEADLVAIFEDSLRNAGAVDQRSIRAVEVLDDVVVAGSNDASMFSRDAFVVQSDAGGLSSTKDHLAPLDLVHLPDVRALEHDQISTITLRPRPKLVLELLYMGDPRGFAIIFVRPSHTAKPIITARRTRWER